MPTERSKPATDELKIAPLPAGGRRTAVQAIHADLRNRIINLELQPGATLSQKDLAASFGCSQTPVREALILLSEERLVDIFPQSRTVVAAIDVQRAREAHFLRRSVEVEIVRNLAPKISPRQIAELRVSVAQQQLNAADGDLGAFSVNDDRFHQLTYEYMNVGGLWELVRSGSAHLDRLRRLDLPMGSKVEDILVAHTAIVDALETGDPAAAEETVRAHLKGTVFAADAIRAHFPEYFEPVAEAVRAP